MPFVTVNNTRLFYRLEGRAELPVLVLCHSLGCDSGMWDPQMPDLLEHFGVLRYDTRGHGASDVPPGDYSIDMIGRDAQELCAALGVTRFAFCGLSMGGAVGQWLAINAPEKISALVLANTAPQFGTREAWEARLQAVRQGGMPAVADAVMERFLSPANRTSAVGQSVRAVVLATDPAGYAGCCVALRDVNFKDSLRTIKVPTFVMGSDQDPSTPWQGNGDVLAREIVGAKAVVLRGAHLSNLEQPRSFASALLNFLVETLTPAADPLQAGLSMRRRILGDEHVERSMSAATDFTRDFQELITRYAWGAVWKRPGLNAHTRRLLVLAMMPALARWEEFRLHLRAAVAHGMEPCEVKEVLLQVAVYAGVPAANTAFQIAREEMEKLQG